MNLAEMEKQPMISKQDLVDLGIPPTQAERIIRNAKKSAVAAGFVFYKGKQNFAPTRFVFEITGFGEVA